MRNNKRAAFEQLLQEGITALAVEARAEGVCLPPHVVNGPDLAILNFSHAYRLDTFEITDDGVCASLSFHGAPWLCVVPWSAVVGIHQHITVEGLTTSKALCWSVDAVPEIAAYLRQHKDFDHVIVTTRQSKLRFSFDVDLVDKATAEKSPIEIFRQSPAPVSHLRLVSAKEVDDARR